jgi:hypothetical protein
VSRILIGKALHLFEAQRDALRFVTTQEQNADVVEQFAFVFKSRV